MGPHDMTKVLLFTILVFVLTDAIIFCWLVSNASDIVLGVFIMCVSVEGVMRSRFVAEGWGPGEMWSLDKAVIFYIPFYQNFSKYLGRSTSENKFLFYFLGR